MANVFATKNGNWSDITVWNTGALPTTADDVFANNFTVTIDQNITIISINTIAATGINAGGGFTLTGNFNVTCTSPTFGIVPGSTTCLTYNGTGTVIVTARMRGSTTTGAIPAMNITGTGNITIAGYVEVGAGFNSHTIQISANATISIIGNVVNNNATGSNGVILINSGCILNITGDLQVVGSGNNVIVFSTSAGNTTINITGNLSTANASLVIRTGTSAAGFRVFNITGNLSGRCISSAPTRFTTTADYTIDISVVGNITATSTDCVIDYWITSVNVTIAGIITNGQQIPGRSKIAVYASNIYLVPSINTYWRFYTNSGQLSLVPYYASGFVPDQPVQSNVRQGVSYGLGSLTGTLVVPSPANVRRGVPTDNTVGTADITAEDIFNEIASSSNAVAQRLRNIATVQTTGDQVAAANL